MTRLWCDAQPREVEKLTINFKSKLSLLYKTLEASKGRHQSQAPAVRQLLIRLNYNSCADGLL